MPFPTTMSHGIRMESLIFRHFYDSNAELQDRLFGSITRQSAPSAVIFYDADLTGDSVISIRDSVKLEHKVGVDGAKFDMEIVETGAEFVTFLEIDKNHSDCCLHVEHLLSILQQNLLRFGAKTSRGYGMTEIISLKKAEFEFESKQDVRKWLDFDLFDANAWEQLPEFSPETTAGESLCIRLMLKQNGALSIREYTTDIAEEGKTSPDYKQMTLSGGTPVIPGTSWAGAFRERYSSLGGQAAADQLFGYISQTESHKSLITFSESKITDYLLKDVVRNSIDRFSAKTKDAALYTERTCYQGKTELLITVPADISIEEKCCLGAVLLDLHYGYLSVGGLTSVGRGLSQIERISVNGTDKTDCLAPDKLLDLLEVNA